MPTLREVCRLVKIQADPSIHSVIDGAHNIAEIAAILHAAKAMAPVGPPLGGPTLSTIASSIDDVQVRLRDMGQLVGAMHTHIRARPDVPANTVNLSTEAAALSEAQLVMTHVGTNKIGVIKAIREVTNLGLKEAKDVADACDTRGLQVILPRAPLAKADRAAATLRAAGARVALTGPDSQKSA